MGFEVKRLGASVLASDSLPLLVWISSPLARHKGVPLADVNSLPIMHPHSRKLTTAPWAQPIGSSASGALLSRVIPRQLHVMSDPRFRPPMVVSK